MLSPGRVDPNLEPFSPTMDCSLSDFQSRLGELQWQDRVRLRGVKEGLFVPELPSPKDSRSFVLLLRRGGEERVTFVSEQNERIYFFCAYYEKPRK